MKHSYVRVIVKKLIKYFSFFTAAVTVFIIVLIAYSIFSQRLIFFEGKPLESIQVSREFYKSLSEQNFVIQNEAGFASGFRLRESNAFFTNYHVVKDLCMNGICKNIRLQYADWNNYSKFPLQVNFCSRWLDICVLTPYKETLTLNNPVGPIKNESQAYMLLKEDSGFSKQLNVSQGQLLEKYGPFSIYKINVKHGYSGSPLFNDKEEVIGLVSMLDVESYWAIPATIHYLIFNWAVADKAIIVNFNDFLKIIQSKNRTEDEASLFVGYFKLILSQDKCPRYINYLNKMGTYQDAKNELCLKNTMKNEFEILFREYCINSSDFTVDEKYHDRLINNPIISEFMKFDRLFRFNDLNTKERCYN